MSDRYLVTGATGFVGACLVRELISQKKSVAILVRNKKLNWRIADIAKKIKVYEVDLLDKKLENILQEIKPTYIFHLAAYGAVPGKSDINELITTNLQGTIKLIEAAKKTPFKLFINTGSSSEYGVKTKKMKETDLAVPINDYGITKLSATLFAQKEAIRNNLPIITFRLFTPYGPYDFKDRFIPYILLHTLQKKSMELSHAKNVRDFIFINDVISAYLLATTKIFNPGEIFNIGSGKQHQVQEVIDTLFRLTGTKVPLSWNKVKRDVQIEPKKWEASISKAKTTFGWQPEYNLRDGLAETIKWYTQNIKLYEKS